MVPDRIAVGKVTKSHGVRGEVAVLVLSETPDRFDTGRSLLLGDGRALTVAGSRAHHGRLLVTFDGLTDRAAADRLRGAYLFVPTDDLPALGEGAWWPHELEGCAVRTEEGEVLGTLTEVLHTEANDIWVTRDGERETLIPALRDIVVTVDLAAKAVTVRGVDGLTTTDDRPE